MSTDKDVPVACSAPGKVLFAGGYLVLDRQVHRHLAGIPFFLFEKKKRSSSPEASLQE